MFYLPTFEECELIVNSTEYFKRKTVLLDGYEVYIYNYFLAMPKDFVVDVGNRKIPAHELRGLTFVKQEDGSFKRNLMLHKFFNVNQCEGYLETDLKNLNIVSEQNKLDGSMVRFITLPNGNIVSKTKMDFFNDQTRMAQKFIEENKNYYLFLKEAHENNLAPIFEYTSIHNRIVLLYKESKLTLIQMRDENTGEYFNIEEHDLVKKYNIETVERNTTDKSLCYYLDLKKNVTHKEGWVLLFKNPTTNKIERFAKVKTDWYMEKHKIATEGLSRENLLMEIVLEDSVDDVLAEFDQDDPRRDLLNDLVLKYNNYFTKQFSDLKEFFFSNYKGDKKEFAVKFKNTWNFTMVSGAMKYEDKELQEEAILKSFKRYIEYSVRRLETARDFLKNNLDFSLEDYH